MDPTTTCCPHQPCPARGQTGQGHLGIHSHKDKRCICHACHKTFRPRKGTVFYRLRTSAETGVIVVTLRAPGCPVHAIGAACGFDERTVTGGWARSGRQGQAGHASLVAPPRALGQVQADALRIKKQGGLVWMAMAMMGQTRLWLGGEGRALRTAPAPAAHRRGAALCGTSSPGGLYRWLGGLQPGHAGDLSRARASGPGGRATAAAVAPWLDRPGRQALCAAAGGGDRPPHCRWHAGTRGAAPTPVARGGGEQDSLHGAAQRDVSGTPRTAGPPLPGPGPPHPDVARGEVLGRDRRELLHAP
jgi:transposase-like protein